MSIPDRLLTQWFRHHSRRLTRFAEVQPADALPSPQHDRYMLYLHIPFCMVLCPFCSFHRVCFEKGRALRYFQCLRLEIDRAHEAGYRFREVYVGGGTPTVLPAELITTLERVQRTSPVESIAVETNPDDLRPEILLPLRDAGVTRLSVGIQSLDDRLLKEMVRYDKYGSGERMLERLSAAEGIFPTFNADMIFNLPHQDEESLARDVELLTGQAEVDQLTFYPLMSAKSTRLKMARTMGVVDYDREGRLYRLILDRMPDNYHAVSAWCFSRGDSRADEYIIENEEYLGLGSGSLSYLDGVLYASTFSLDHYERQIAAGHFGFSRRQRLSERDRMRYYLLMHLFGLFLDKSAAQERFPGFLRRLAPEIAALKAIGAVSEEGDRLVLTRYGMRIWVLIMREFFVAVSDFRDLMRGVVSDEEEPHPGPLELRLPTADTGSCAPPRG